MKITLMLTLLLVPLAVWTTATAAEKVVPPAKVQVADIATPEAIAAMRADVHRKMAELIEARAASTPDRARIDKLAKELQDLRLQCRSTAPLASAAAVAAPAGDWVCPFGGPGLGQGRGPGYGRGAGPGRGNGRGMGMGRCAASGCCPWASSNFDY